MLNNFELSKALLIFFTYIVIDVLYALYVICVNKRKAFASAMVSSGIYSLGAFGVVSFSKNLLYIVPLATGAFLGTYIVVKFEKYFFKS
jgi:hypothetical protein